MRKCAKKILALNLAILLAALSFVDTLQISASAVEIGDIAISMETFPDAAFCAYVAEEFDTNSDGNLSAEERNAVRYIYVDSMGISSLTGIEHFKNLYYLDCHDNQLADLDVSNNTKLQDLSCYRNQLTELDVSNNVSLTYLNCSSNQLSELDVSKNVALTDLSCFRNELTELDVSKNAALNRIACSNNQLTELDVSNNEALESIDCSINKILSSVILPNSDSVWLLEEQNTSVQGILGFKEKIRTYNGGSIIDGSEIDNLYNGSLYRMDTVAEITLVKNYNGDNTEKTFYLPHMIGFPVENICDILAAPDGMDIAGWSTEPDGSGDYYTIETRMDSYAFDTLILYAQWEEESVVIDERNFPDAAFLAYVSDRFDRNNSGALSQRECNAVAVINVNDTGIRSLQGIDCFQNLTHLYCSNNHLTKLDVSHNTELIAISCNNNQLTVLDVNNNPVLVKLSCEGNMLTSLNVSNNTKLQSLHCDDNQLSELDLQNNALLVTLTCANNEIETLDIVHLAHLQLLYCIGNCLTSLTLPDGEYDWIDQESKLTEAPYQHGSTITIYGGVYLVPTYLCKKIALHSNQNDCHEQQIIYTIASSGSLTVFAMDGIFADDSAQVIAWNTKADGSGTRYSGNDMIPWDTAELYAQWLEPYMPENSVMIKYTMPGESVRGITATVSAEWCAENGASRIIAALYSDAGQMLTVTVQQYEGQDITMKMPYDGEIVPRCKLFAVDAAGRPIKSWQTVSYSDDDAFSVNNVVGFSRVNLNGTKLPNGNRDGETNMGDLITDAMLWFAKQNLPITIDDDHVVALTNAGGIRASIGQGYVLCEDINAVLAFRNTVSVVYVTGAQLLEALEAATYYSLTASTTTGAFPQVAGINYTVDTTKAYNASAQQYPDSDYYAPASINRVTINSINGEAFIPTDTYAVVTNNFCAWGGDTYYVFTQASDSIDSPYPYNDALASYIVKELHGLIGVEYAYPQGRITVSAQ